MQKSLAFLISIGLIVSSNGWTADPQKEDSKDPQPSLKRKRKPKLKLNLNLDSNITSNVGVMNSSLTLRTEAEVLQDKIWVDLAPSQHYELDERFHDLTYLIDLYAKQEKTSPGHVLFRKELLKKIAVFCEANLDRSDPNSKSGPKKPGEFQPKLVSDLSEDDKLKLQLIFQTASNKLEYLNELKKIKNNALKMLFPSPSSEVPSAQLGKDFILENGDTTNRWELLEHLDPAMRSRQILGPLFQIWKKEAQTHKGTPSFFYWLEGQDISLARNEGVFKPELESYSGTATRIVTFKEGKASSAFFPTRSTKVYRPETLEHFKHEESDPVTHSMTSSFERDDQKLQENESSATLHYAIGMDGTLYIRYKSPYHSYVLRGQPVASAGMITFRDGKIDSISNDSGHYMPSEAQLDNAIRLLKEKYNDEENKIFTSTFRKINHGKTIK